MRRKPRKLTPEKREEILKLRGEGLGYGTIAKEVKVSKSSVISIVKAAQPILDGRDTSFPVADEKNGEKPANIPRQPENAPSGPSYEPIAARIRKPFPNPRIMAIYFGERKEEKYGKVVVKPFLNYPPNSKINVLPVEGEDGLYRIA